MIFVDTGYFLGLLQSDDPLNQRARGWSRAIREPILTTEFILVEVAALSSPRNRRRVAPFFASLRQSPLYEIVPASSELFERTLRANSSSELFEAGLQFYDARSDKE